MQDPPHLSPLVILVGYVVVVALLWAGIILVGSWIIDRLQDIF